MSDDPSDERPGDEVPPDTPSAGDDSCPDCGGTGRVGGNECPTCGGDGLVRKAVGGG